MSKTQNKKIVSIILAAGKGTRMNVPDMAKVCFTLEGKAVIKRALETYKKVGIDSNYIVVGNLAEQVMQAVQGIDTNNFFCYQQRQLGTGNAAKSAAKLLESMDYDGDILIVAGDKVIETEILEKLIESFYKGKHDMVFLTGSTADNPASGRIVYSGDGNPIGNIEVFDIARCALLHELKEKTKTAELAAEEAEKIVRKHLKTAKKAELAIGAVWDMIKDGVPISSQTLRQYFTNDDYYLNVNNKKYLPHEIQAEQANLSVYLLKSKALYFALKKLGYNNAQKEEYLTDIIEILAEAGYNLKTLSVDYKEQVLAFNTPEELETIRRYYAHKKSAAGMQNSGKFRMVKNWLKEFKAKDDAVMSILKSVYGEDDGLIDYKRKRIIVLLESYLERYGNENVLISHSPGRLNIMGRHIDHQGGFSNMMAIDRDVYCIVGERDDRQVNISNLDAKRFPDRTFNIDELIDAYEGDWIEYINGGFVTEQNREAKGDWSQYIKAVTARLSVMFPENKLKGMNIMAAGDIPIASGLSSSSALLVSVAEAVTVINNIDLDDEHFVTMCAEAEWFVGTRGGSGDHAAMKFCKRGMVSQMSFFPNKHLKDLPAFDDYHFVICNSRVTARKTVGAKDIFNHRVACYHIGRELFKQQNPQYADRITHLRDINTENLKISRIELFDLLKKLPLTMTREEIFAALPAETAGQYIKSHSSALNDYPIRDVVIYGLAEIERSRSTFKLLEEADVDEFGRWMNISHNGDRVVYNGEDYSIRYHDALMDELINSKETELHEIPGSYSCSAEAIDNMVDIALSVEGVKGAQIAGAGLGGCIMVLVKSAAFNDLKEKLKREYYEPRRLEEEVFICRPSQGSGVFHLSES